MAGLELFWSETALKQRNDTFKFWNKKNGSKVYSQRLNILIKDRSNKLVLFPEIGRRAEIDGIRVISIEHFSLFYEKYNDKIVIISFWDNRRNPKKFIRNFERDKLKY